MEKLRPFLVVSVFALLVAACGGGETSTSSNQTTTQPVTVSLSDLSATVEISSTHQFSATVENAEDTSVDWQVNKVSGGDSTVGTISDAGLYTAPDRVPSPVTVTVTAVARADATKEASATVTIMSNVTVAVSPADTTLPAGESVQLTANIENAVDTAAKWTVNDLPGGDATVGTISAGFYTAPSLPPPGGVVTITAISLADTSKTDSVNVTVQFSNASLNGPYVFTFSGNDPGGPFHAAGRFVADGNGNITDGIEDFNGAEITPSRTFTGTYEARPEREGRVSVTLYVSGPEETGAANFRFQLTNAGEGPMTSFNDFMTGSGQIYKQDKTTFSNASMKGAYAFQFFGASEKGGMVGAGIFKCDGAGNMTGIEDINQNELVTKIPMSGTYSVSPNGRTILTTTVTTETETQTSQTAVYLISNDRAVFVPSGFEGGGLGEAEKQQITNFSNASISGGYVYFANGDPAVEGDFALGFVYANGAGEIPNGVEDNNYHGSVTKDNNLTGTYSIPATDLGRGTVTITTAEGTGGAIIYLVSEKKAFLLGTEPGEPTCGQIVAVQGGSFSVSSLQGKFVFSLRGFNATAEVGTLGQLTLDGNGALTGNQAVNSGGTLTPNVSISGKYFLTPIGRGDLTITDGTIPSSFMIYVADSSHAYLIETDASGTATFGSMEAQFPAQPQAGLGTTY